MTEEHVRYMRMALEEAERAAVTGDGPIGSVIVRDGEIISRGRNRVHTTHDATAHAETDAIRIAGAAIEDYQLTGSTLYTTFEPCPMCCGAIINAGITTLVMGGRIDPDDSRWGGYSVEGLIDDLGWSDRITVITGIMPEECVALAEAHRH